MQQALWYQSQRRHLRSDTSSISIAPIENPYSDLLHPDLQYMKLLTKKILIDIQFYGTFI